METLQEAKDAGLQLYFSLTSGEIYSLQKDDKVDEFQVPLLKRPSTSCKKCQGRLYTGRNIVYGHFILCKPCFKKCVDHKKIQELVKSVK